MTTTSAPAKGAQPILFAPVGVGASLRRIGALVRRYIYLLRSSGVRLVELDLLALPPDAHLGLPAKISGRDQRARWRRPPAC